VAFGRVDLVVDAARAPERVPTEAEMSADLVHRRRAPAAKKDALRAEADARRR